MRDWKRHKDRTIIQHNTGSKKKNQKMPLYFNINTINVNILIYQLKSIYFCHI